MSSIFLSHNHKDKAFVRKLASNLDLFGVKSWVDEYEMLPGDSLIGKMESGIESSEFLGAVLSANSVASEWVTRELRAALTDEIANRRIKVIPLLIEDCSLPPILRDKLFADFRTDFYIGLTDVLRRVVGDTIDPNMLQQNVTDWSKRHYHEDRRSAFLQYVRDQIALRKRQAKERDVRSFLAGSSFEDVLKSVQEDTSGDFVEALINIFHMSEDCQGYHCYEPLRTTGTLGATYGESCARQLLAAVHQSGHDKIELDHYVYRRTEADGLMLCEDCTMRNHGNMD